ncbi:amidohydrolase family protein [Kribbella sp. GL6]|uniref:amidohydrolase family protein n=1 Tax=Kribbella sp. GL6 TaxID=3419765 RepID=UPI003D05BBF9
MTVGYRAARVLTGRDGQVLRDGEVLVSGERIEAVRPGTTDPPYPVVDFGDATIVPGIIDAHVHLTMPADGRDYAAIHRDPDELLALVAAANLRRLSAAGITTVRDNGGRNTVMFAVREGVRRGYLAGPRLLLAGRPITPTLGHFHFCNGEADGADAIRAAVRRLVAQGADHIKLMASGGGTPGSRPDQVTYTVAELRVAVDAAHALGVPTTAHCRSTGSIRNAVEAGVDCVEHADFLADGRGGAIDYDPALVEQMLAAGVFVSMTLQAGGAERRQRFRTADRPLPPAEQAEYDGLRRYFDAKLGVVRRLLADGYAGRMAISSDAGPGDTEFARTDLWLRLAGEAGMPAVAAIEAFTRVPAELLGLDDAVGTLAAGKVADLVVVDGDPLLDPDAISHPVAVLRGGRRADSPCDGTPGVPLRRVERDLCASDRTRPERSRHV